MKKNTIDVILNLASPLYEAYPGNYKDGLSYTMKKRVYVDGQIVHVPFYAANGFRGGLRRMIAARIVNHLAATGGAISGELYNGLRCGASGSSPDQTALSIEEILRARRHVYMGLFGGGARIHESMYQVSDMNPILRITRDVGMIPAFFDQSEIIKERKKGDEVGFAEPKEIVGKRHFVRKDDLYNVANPEELIRVVNNPAATVNQHQEAIGLQRGKDDEALKAEGKKHASDVSNLQAFESIAEGTPMHFRITLDNDITNAQVGAMLLALSDLFNENQFGGWVRTGMGKVRVQMMQMSLTENDNMGRDNLSTYQWDALNDGDEFVLPAEALPFVEAAEEELAAVTIETIAPFFTDFSAGKKADDKAKNKAKLAAEAK